jgi:toxin FitB
VTYLVDANVLSEATKPAPNRFVIDWLRRTEREIAVDPFIIGELQFGILILPSGRRKRRLQQWFEQGIVKVRCLEWNSASGLRWANLVAELRRTGQTMAIKDSLIAATALVHGLTLATRNTKDFTKAGVAVVNPFEEGAE